MLIPEGAISCEFQAEAKGNGAKNGEKILTLVHGDWWEVETEARRKVTERWCRGEDTMNCKCDRKNGVSTKIKRRLRRTGRVVPLKCEEKVAKEHAASEIDSS